MKNISAKPRFQLFEKYNNLLFKNFEVFFQARFNEKIKKENLVTLFSIKELLEKKLLD